MQVKHTYSARVRQIQKVSMPLQSDCSSKAIISQKRPLEEHLENHTLAPSRKRVKKNIASSQSANKLKTQTMTQLHFCIDQTIIRTCPLCDLSYTKGAPEDEGLHRTHCSRVQKGMEWGREEEKEKTKAGVTEISNNIRLKDGKKGRIICFPAEVGGKIGCKLSTLLETINIALSSPPLSPAALRCSKVYLFLLPHATLKGREKIIGCVLAQRITFAMKIATQEEISGSDSRKAISTPPLVTIDVDSGLFGHPEPLPTPMGIPRLFVPAAHRRKGVAGSLLSAAAESFIHGCILDPTIGQVAFTQPTGAGDAVMRWWGRGGVRIYEE